MRISTKGIYAVRFMIHLTERGQGGPIALKDVSQRQGISKKYLEQIVPNLVAAKLVKSVRGANGGYQLAMPANRITVRDVLAATEGDLSPVDFDEIDPAGSTMDYNLWKGLDRIIGDYLSGITFQQLVDDESAIAADSYSI